MNTNPGLIPDLLDERSLNFLASSLPKYEEYPKRKYRYWNDTARFWDQGNTSSCVGHGFAHVLVDGPVTQPELARTLNPYADYREIQALDPWGRRSADDGTTLLAGAKYHHKQGNIGGYYWVYVVDEMGNTVLEVAPVVTGTLWRMDMFYPNDEGVIRATGREVGGHCYEINGYNAKTELFRIKQSYGRNHGRNGRLYIPAEDLDKLMQTYGEACVVSEVQA